MHAQNHFREDKKRKALSSPRQKVLVPKEASGKGKTGFPGYPEGRGRKVSPQDCRKNGRLFLPLEVVSKFLTASDTLLGVIKTCSSQSLLFNMSCKDKCVRTFWQLKKYILFFLLFFF